MFKVKVDVMKNRLYIILEGFFTHEEMKECTDKTIEESKKLKQGYDVITDISQFHPVGPETIKEIERGQAHFIESGVRYGIRVVGNTAVVTGMQFDRIGQSMGYIPATVETMADAEKFLDGKE